MNKSYKCICNSYFEASEFKKHFSNCKKFCEEYKDFDKKISELIKEYFKSEETLFHLEFLMKIYLKKIKDELGKFSKVIQEQKYENNIIINNNINTNSNFDTKEISYFTSSLRALAYLDGVKNLTVKPQGIEMKMPCMNKFLMLFYHNQMNPVDIEEESLKNLIYLFTDKYMEINNNQIPKHDPKDFVKNFLKIIQKEEDIKYEKSSEIYTLSNLNLDKLKNENYTLNFILNYKKENYSFVLNNISNIIINKIESPNIQDLYFCSLENVIEFDVDKYKYTKKKSYESDFIYLDLEECFNYYLDGQNKCIFCNTIIPSEKILFHMSKILIMCFNRKDHVLKGDIIFKEVEKFSFGKFKLKSCIFYTENDIYICDSFTNGYWHRFNGFNIEYHKNKNKELYNYEPQVLIYESVII